MNLCYDNASQVFLLMTANMIAGFIGFLLVAYFFAWLAQESVGEAMEKRLRDNELEN